MPELMVILVIALVVFGAGKLPQIGEDMGKAIRDFKSPTQKRRLTPKEARRDFRKRVNSRRFLCSLRHLNCFIRRF